MDSLLPHNSIHQLQQLRGAEGLCEVVVSSHSLAPFFVCLLALDRQHDNYDKIY
jgi:hypothetical protein